MWVRFALVCVRAAQQNDETLWSRSLEGTSIRRRHASDRLSGADTRVRPMLGSGERDVALLGIRDVVFGNPVLCALRNGAWGNPVLSSR